MSKTIARWSTGSSSIRSCSGSGVAAALQRLRLDETRSELPQAMRAFGIHGGGVVALFASHPPLDKRIARLTQPAAPGGYGAPPYAQPPR